MNFLRGESLVAGGRRQVR